MRAGGTSLSPSVAFARIEQDHGAFENYLWNGLGLDEAAVVRLRRSSGISIHPEIAPAAILGGGERAHQLG